MKGVDHAALMDRVYHHQRHFYDVTRKYFLFGRDRLLREMNVKPGQHVVEIGCGTARNLIKLAQLYPQAVLFGLDASREMLRTAESHLTRAGLAGKVRLSLGLAENVAASNFRMVDSFDHAVFSYSLSMIPDWQGAIHAAALSLKASGKIHAVDFGDLNGLNPWAAAGLRAWLRLFHVTPRTELIQIIERQYGADSLRHLRGRYAFLLHLGREQALHDFAED